MQDVYAILKPVFNSETMQAALRQAGLARQTHLAAGLRKEAPSAKWALSAIRTQHDFMGALCQAFIEADVSVEVTDALGYHSMMFFGINPRLFEIACLAVSGAEEYSLETLKSLLKDRVDINEIISGDADPIDTLMWLSHMGTNFASYLAECRQ